MGGERKVALFVFALSLFLRSPFLVSIPFFFLQATLELSTLRTSPLCVAFFQRDRDSRERREGEKGEREGERRARERGQRQGAMPRARGERKRAARRRRGRQPSFPLSRRRGGPPRLSLALTRHSLELAIDPRHLLERERSDSCGGGRERREARGERSSPARGKQSVSDAFFDGNKGTLLPSLSPLFAPSSLLSLPLCRARSGHEQLREGERRGRSGRGGEERASRRSMLCRGRARRLHRVQTVGVFLPPFCFRVFLPPFCLSLPLIFSSQDLETPSSSSHILDRALA